MGSKMAATVAERERAIHSVSLYSVFDLICPCSTGSDAVMKQFTLNVLVGM